MAGTATVEKALDLLFHLHQAGTPLGLSELGRELRLPKSSCHRLLGALVDRGMVERDAGGRYRPGLALLALGLGAQQQEPVVRASRPVLEEEAVALGETVFLVARRHGRLQVLDKSEGAGFLRVAPDVGDPLPEDVTAVGKLYRAASAQVGDPDPELSRIRARGHATNRDAWIPGLSVLATPIRWPRAEPGDEPAAALALGAPSGRFEELGESRIAARLRSAAIRIERRLAGLAEGRPRRRTSPRTATAQARLAEPPSSPPKETP